MAGQVLHARVLSQSTSEHVYHHRHREGIPGCTRLSLCIHTPCLRSRLMDQHQIFSWKAVGSRTSAWELPGHRRLHPAMAVDLVALTAELPICSSTSPCCASQVSPSKEARVQPPLPLLFKLTDIVSHNVNGCHTYEPSPAAAAIRSMAHSQLDLASSTSQSL